MVPAAADRTAPAFTDHVLQLLQHDPRFAVLGPDPQARADRLFREGLRIETTLDPEWQAAAEDALEATVSEPGDPAAALVAIDPATGSVRAIAATTLGGDASVAGFNLATQARRQPGSTFKAVLLAAALEQGNSLDEVFPAPAEVDIPARPPAEPEVWTVRNYDDADYGALTLREATARSANVVFAQLIDRVGAEAVADTAWRLGVRRDLPQVRSLALGAVEVSPLELASVQATLAAGGVYREPTFVTRIADAGGQLLWERAPTAGQRVLDDGVAWLVTTALRDVVASGTGTAADLRRPTAGKTGTSQDGADAWFAGYTPDLAAAVWIGFPEGRVEMEPPRTRVRVEGGKWPAEAFARFGLSALAQVPANDFPLPSDALTTVRVDATRGCLPNPFTPPEVVAERSYLVGTEPTKACTEPADPPRVEVPEVTGLGVDAAIERLEAAGFAVRRREAFSTQLPPGFVVRQIPGPGEQELLAGFTATVFSSVADRSDVPIPDVLGQPLATARVALETAGFVVEADLGCPDGAEVCAAAAARPGEVWEQSPATDAAPRASTVRLSAYPAAD
ncbi:MAG: penicillin-binding transpeptidase domain-containing protein [Egibacteraceae bacterium]